MAKSTCPKCKSTSFETVEYLPKNSEYIYLLLQCDACGAVIASIEHQKLPSNLLDKLRQKD